jgi:hypothetical protein
LLFLLPPSPAILVRWAYGRTTPQSGSDNAFLSSWVSWNHGRVLLQNSFSYLFRNGIAAAGDSHFGNCSFFGL